MTARRTGYPHCAILGGILLVCSGLNSNAFDHQKWASTVTLTVDPHELSDVIGAVYDSMVDVEMWPRALERICGLFDARLGSISVINPTIPTVRFMALWGGDPHWIRLLEERYAVMMPYFSVLHRFAVGQPFNGTMMAEYFDGPAVDDGQFVREWAAPFDVMDSLNTIVMRGQGRLVTLNLSTSANRDAVAHRDLELMRLIIPHVQRALTIGDLLDSKRVEIAAFERTLDALRISVVFVNADARILHANQAALEMLDAGEPIVSALGAMEAVSPEMTQRLRAAIRRAACDRPPVDRDPEMSVPLRHVDGSPAIAHVVPLIGGELRPRLVRGAAAAILITPPVAAANLPIEALATLYELTPAEVRVMRAIVAGKNRREAAALLSLADSTVKTHLERVFAKTGTATQQELTRLVADLSAPISRHPE